MSVIVRKPQNKKSPWVVRWQQDGKQKERGFGTKQEATAYKTDLDHGMRYGSHVDTRAGKISFGTAAEAWLERVQVNDRSKETYRGVYSKHIAPVFAGRTLASVAGDRDAVAELLTVTMAGLSISPRRVARMILTEICDEAVKAGKIGSHKLAGIDLAVTETTKYQEFTPATWEQITALADAVGIAAYLMIGLGLRAEEAIGLHREHFRVSRGKVTARISQQASRDGRAFLPCKKRTSTAQFRDVPVPAWLWTMIEPLPAGPLCPGNGRTYAAYESMRQRFQRAAKSAGLPAWYTPHSLRHQYGSVLLHQGKPVPTVARWMGHKDIRTTYAQYCSQIEDAEDGTDAALEALRAA